MAALRTANNALGEMLDALLDISTLNTRELELNPRHVRLYEVLFPIYADYLVQAQERGLQLELNCPPAAMISALLQGLLLLSASPAGRNGDDRSGDITLT